MQVAVCICFVSCSGWHHGHAALVMHGTSQSCECLQAFFADIYAEAKRAKPSLGHKALAALAAQGKLQRHYTLNIDGLARAVGLSTWHPVKNPTGAQDCPCVSPLPCQITEGSNA